MSNEPTTDERIREMVSTNPVLLFMKGNRQAPQCGFSAQVIGILDSFIPDYETVDVLSDPEIRDGIKTFSSWPTIPQLYVDGEFIGGCDIITEMAGSGELFEALGVEPPPEIIPKIHLSDTAAEALAQAIEQTGTPGQFLKLSIDQSWQPNLSMAEKGAMDVMADAGGPEILVDRMSAQRADGITIDLVEGPQGRGFKVENPNAPRMGEMSVQTLKQMMDEKIPFELLDVRTPNEFETARIEGARLLDDEGYNQALALPKETRLVFICHHGPRGESAASQFMAQGFSDVHNLVGGIDAWSIEIDPSVPRY
ncbi:MAG: monothiol glutaredoxin, Grx4 family [Deltaproteobacteria bacterium]|nr:monothiol glutaredoxin, Grx4 family [Deltaproteobacteria bacterium]